MRKSRLQRHRHPKQRLAQRPSSRSHLASVPDTPSSSTLKRQRFWVFALLGVAIAALIAYLMAALFSPTIDHYALDDHSGSAMELSQERKTHCQISAGLYQIGDRRKEVVFADIPDIFNEQTIHSTLLFDPCTDLDNRTADIGRQQGTSPIHALERVALEVQKTRAQQPHQRVVVTMSLHYAEVVNDQPNLSGDDGKERLYQAVSTIIGENSGSIAIIGPTGTLQNELQQLFQPFPQVRVCSFQSMQECITWAFRVVR